MFTKQLHLRFPHAQLSFSTLLTLETVCRCVCGCILGAWRIIHALFKVEAGSVRVFLHFALSSRFVDLKPSRRWLPCPAWLVFKHTFLLSDQGNLSAPLSPLAFITTKHPLVFPQSSNVPLHITFLSDIQSLLFTLPQWPPVSLLLSANRMDFLKLMTSLQSLISQDS